MLIVDRGERVLIRRRSAHNVFDPVLAHSAHDGFEAITVKNSFRVGNIVPSQFATRALALNMRPKSTASSGEHPMAMAWLTLKVHDA